MQARQRVSGTRHCCCKAHKDRERLDTEYGWQDLHVGLKGKQGLAMHLKQITEKVYVCLGYTFVGPLTGLNWTCNDVHHTYHT